MPDSLHSPETVIFDEANNCFYVSNSLEYDFTGTGYITKISADGKLITKYWVSGLNRPTGMTIDQTTLYIGDMDRVIVVNIGDSTILASYPAPPNPFPGVNDVTISAGGELFASASSIHAVLKLANDSMQIWAQDTINLQWANGIYGGEEGLYVAGMKLALVDYQTTVINEVTLSPAIEDFDGLLPDGNEGFFISSAGPGVNTIWHITANRETYVLSKDNYYNGDFEFIPDQNLIITPSGNVDGGEFVVRAFILNK